MELTDAIAEKIAAEIQARPEQVAAAVELLDGGATVPFIARYRKEATRGLDDTQLRQLEVRLSYLRELNARRQTILETLRQTGKLSSELGAQILAVQTKQELEDLYAPYKQKRKTRGMMAREAGLEPLAERLLEEREIVPEIAARAFVSEEKGVPDVESALNGARDILAENLALDPAVRRMLRDFLLHRGEIVSVVCEGMEEEGANFKDYFDWREALETIPAHRALALLRGRREGCLNLSVELPAEEEAKRPHPAECVLARHIRLHIQDRSARTVWLLAVCRWAWRVKLRASIEADLLEQVRSAAEEAAITVFGVNLRDLLLAPPAGHRRVLGLDPGFRTGVKAALIDETGRVLAHDVLMFHRSECERRNALERFWKLLERGVELIAVGNGTASRETMGVVTEALKSRPDVQARCVFVSEAGASVYSASALASEELPELDVSYRGAVSIARRLQDPLAELVKIDPKAIGVGQYQHDVDHSHLESRLESVVEDCVNFVGVDVNTASAELLSHVAGLTRRVAKEIVTYRNANGAFESRESLKKVPYLGAARFQQAAGFLRIPRGANPLDATGVHPEAYGVVERMRASTGIRNIRELLGRHEVLGKLRAADFVDEKFGLPTITDILKELEKPGRDPRREFRVVDFNENVRSIEDLRVGMKLQGVVTNVAAFGAFVDVGVHESGLVHVSALSDRFVKDPRDVVHVGDVVQVTVLDVDAKRRRIALSMRKDPSASKPRSRGKENRRSAQTAMAAAFLGKLRN